MKPTINELIALLGATPDDPQMEQFLEKIGKKKPKLKKGKDSVWIESSPLKLEILFKDEALISRDPYADIGDGDLLFATLYCNNLSKVELPYGITPNDNAEQIRQKIGRKEDDYDLELKSSSWLFNREDGLEYMIFFDFKDKEFTTTKRFGVIYSYGQLPWVEELKGRQ